MMAHRHSKAVAVLAACLSIAGTVQAQDTKPVGEFG